MKTKKFKYYYLVWTLEFRGGVLGAQEDKKEYEYGEFRGGTWTGGTRGTK